MKPPSAALIVDATVLIAAAFGRSSGALAKAHASSVLLTTDRAIEEARRRIVLGLKRPELLKVLDDVLTAVAIVPIAELDPLRVRAEAALRDAVPSRNGSTRDAHVLALAWSTDADIWTADRDFVGTGVATWSTPNLLRAYADTANVE